MTPAHLETLLSPIAAERPTGSDESYSPECDEIRKLRKGDDPSLSQGEWVRELRPPQWPKVRDLCESILTARSKDLQVACWYTEAIVYMEGFPGLAFGLKLIDGLLARYAGSEGSGLFPQDPEERIAKLEWFNAQMPLVIKSVPMSSPKTGGYSFLRWEESRLVENLGVRDPKAKESAIADGKLCGEAWDKSAASSGQAFYLRLFEQIQAGRKAFEAIEERIERVFQHEAPSLASAREALNGCHELANQMLRRFGLDPSVEAAAAAAAPTLNLDATPPAPASAVAAVPVASGPIGSRAEAIRRLREVAKYFRDHEPHSPVGPLAERAARWGEMPLEQWLSRVIKDEGTLGQLRDLLDLQPEL